MVMVMSAWRGVLQSKISGGSLHVESAGQERVFVARLTEPGITGGYRGFAASRLWSNTIGECTCTCILWHPDVENCKEADLSTMV